jgi:hypothetical protein
MAKASGIQRRYWWSASPEAPSQGPEWQPSGNRLSDPREGAWERGGKHGREKADTISLPPPLVKKAEELAREEHRTKSELPREALPFYVATEGPERSMCRPSDPKGRR